MTSPSDLPLRARVALLLGYEIHDTGEWETSYLIRPDGQRDRTTNPRFPLMMLIPPYDTSRDAVAVAEDALLTTDDLELAYVLALRDVMYTRQFRKVVRATAAQRCEALLAALGKGVAG